ncbi:histidine phosphatase family protein [Candidatus Dojkabacteria bacterium]|uniref:Histidine phosphatase family protein n=1 Tax=Candidatus Dojkabacteria bacterium TaxID=2099670 RepID=A0A955RKS3_9BACT|nr:histidine phosphatase family protein [Candidatus Dojkabacteria bacterium]
MHILFIRHGESIDDIEDRYGGFADFDLTEKGRNQVSACTKKILDLDEKFEIILSSPLKRAHESAKIIATEFNLEIEIFEYLKERNLNGVLTGLTKSEAKEKYPNLVKIHNRWEYVDGSERTNDFNTRVKNGIQLLLDMKYDSLIAVTHGLFLKTFFKELMCINIAKVGDGGFALTHFNDKKFTLIQSDKIEFA